MGVSRNILVDFHHVAWPLRTWLSTRSRGGLSILHLFVDRAWPSSCGIDDLWTGLVHLFIAPRRTLGEHRLLELFPFALIRLVRPVLWDNEKIPVFLFGARRVTHEVGVRATNVQCL